MNWGQIEVRWSEFAGSARAHWSKLTDNDSQVIAGKKEQLVALIQERYGVPRVSAEQQVDDWSNGLLDVSGPAETR